MSEIFQLIIGLLAGSLLVLILPFLTQSVVDQGTHKELIAKKGYYFQLIENQLELGT